MILRNEDCLPPKPTLEVVLLFGTIVVFCFLYCDCWVDPTLVDVVTVACFARTVLEVLPSLTAVPGRFFF